MYNTTIRPLWWVWALLCGALVGCHARGLSFLASAVGKCGFSGVFAAVSSSGVSVYPVGRCPIR